MLSTLISAYKDHEITKIHVRECMAGTLIPDEIIVVNDGGTPDLKDKLLELDIKTKLVYATIKEDIPWNYTGARNLGIWLSTGDIISLEDNDHIPTREFYEDCLNKFKESPETQRIRTHKRRVIAREDVLTNPMEEWVQISSRPPHQDVTVNRRELFLKLKGYDERFSGEYGWCATDLKRRLMRMGIETADAGYQYVVYSEKTRGLSYRNFRLARTQDDIQSPMGILNFKYEYETIGDKK